MNKTMRSNKRYGFFIGHVPNKDYEKYHNEYVKGAISEDEFLAFAFNAPLLTELGEVAKSPEGALVVKYNLMPCLRRAEKINEIFVKTHGWNPCVINISLKWEGVIKWFERENKPLLEAGLV